MKRLIAAVAVAAAPLFVLGAAAPAEAAGHCKCDKPGHHAKASAKKAKPHARRAPAKKQHHAGKSGDGMNTYGWQRQMGHGHSYGHGPGYGYVGEPNREGPYVRQYSSVDVQTSYYDSGWRETYSGAPVPPPHGYGVGGHGYGQSYGYDSGWRRHGGAGPCPHPGAVACLPPGHPPVGPVSYGYGGHDVKVGSELLYGGLAGGVSGPESFGGYPSGGGVVVFGSSTGGSAFASSRAEAYAAASAYSRGKAYGGRRGYGKKKH